MQNAPIVSPCRNLPHPSFRTDERGLTTVEYVIILVLIAVGAIGLWRAFGGAVNQRIDNSSTSIRDMSAQTGSPGDSQSPGSPGQSQPAGASVPANNSPATPAPAIRRGGGKQVSD